MAIMTYPTNGPIEPPMTRRSLWSIHGLQYEKK